jgi:hypothetical protein
LYNKVFSSLDNQDRYIRIYTIKELDTWVAARKLSCSEPDLLYSLYLLQGCLPLLLSCYITILQSSIWRYRVCFFKLISNTILLEGIYFRVVQKDILFKVSLTDLFNFYLLEQLRKKRYRIYTSIKKVLLNFKYPRSGFKKDQQLFR